MDKQTYDLAVTFGRFNLLHHGHIDMFERMGELAPQCLIGVSDNQKNLPVNDRIAVIRIAMGMDFGGQYDTAKANNPFSFFDFVTAKRVVLVLGEDQEALAKAARRVLGWDYHLVKRLGSSTEVRALIDNEDWDRLSRVIPPVVMGKVIALRGVELQREQS